jgi:hypothetical protein
MLHDFLFTLHIVGMTVIALITLIFLTKKEMKGEFRKKLSIYLVSAAHTQLLSGFILSILLISEINQLKIIIKIVLAIAVAILSTIERKKITQNLIPNPTMLFLILSLVFSASLIAFLV